MVCAYVCGRKLLVLATLITLLFVAWTTIVLARQSSRSVSFQGRTTSRTKRFHYSNYFVSYENYSGPQPIPEPIQLPPTLRFVINEPETCSAERHPGLRILCYVHSAPHHFQHRQAIRRTWASSKFYSQFKMATVFFLGQTKNASLQAELEAESAKFKDIVQADFHDDYYNLTYKAAFALSWISQFCGQVEYVLKTDDDVFVNTFRFTSVLFEKSTRDDDFHCLAYFGTNPLRYACRWRISVEEYPWKKYPNYCTGFMFYFGGHLIPKLLGSMPNVPFVKFDDVYVTGMLRQHVGLGIHHMKSEVNRFPHRPCLQRIPTPEAFCLLGSMKAIDELWMQAMMLEIKIWATKNETLKTKYLNTFENILSGNVKRGTET